MIQILDKNDDLAGILQNDSSAAAAYWDDEVYEKLNDVYITLKFKMNADHEAAEYVVHGSKAIIQDLDGDLQIFEIKTVEDYQDSEGHRVKDVYAEHIALELNGRIIRPGEYLGYNAQQFLEMVLEGTRWKVGIVEWLGLHDIVLDEYTSGIKAIIKAASEFEGEFKFRVEMEHGEISNVYVDLLQRRGEDTGVQVLYGHNQESLKRLEDSSEVYTAVIGVAKGSEGGYLTFEDVVADDKPAGQDWIGNDEALQKYGILMPNGERMHYMGVYTYEGENENLTPEELLTFTRRQLTRWSKPKFTYEANVIDLEAISGYDHEKMRLGDTIVINNDDFNPAILMEARIVEFNWSKSDPSKNKVVLGDYRDIWDQNLYEQIQSLRNTIISNAGQWESGGGTMVIRSATAPTDTSAVWIDISTSPNVVKSFNTDTGLWEKASPTVPGDIGAVTDEEAGAIAQETTEAYSEKVWHVGTTPPADVERKWVDTSSDPVLVKVYQDGQWVAAAPTSAEDINAEPDMHVGTTAPADTSRKWLDISKDPAILKAFVNGEWINATPTTAAEVGADPAGSAAAAEEAAKAASDPKGSAAQAKSEAMAYAEKKIYRGAAVPAGAVSGDLWIDESVTGFPVYRKFDGTNWNLMTTWSLADLIGQITGTQIEDSSIPSIKIQSLNADLIDVGSLTGITVDVTNAGMTAEDVVAEAVRIFAGTTWSNRYNAPFRVLQNGKVIASNIDILGGNISIEGDATVGDNLYIGDYLPPDAVVIAEYQKGIYFNTKSTIIAKQTMMQLYSNRLVLTAHGFDEDPLNPVNELIIEGGMTHHSGSFNFGLGVDASGNKMGGTGTVEPETEFLGGIIVHADLIAYYGSQLMGRVDISDDVFITGDLDITGDIWIDRQVISGMEAITSAVETGYCGTGGMTTGVSSAVSGVGVNFRTKKNYTPSSISLSGTASNLVLSTHVHAIDISANGFWLYVDGGNTTNTYRYWRGIYQA